MDELFSAFRLDAPVRKKFVLLRELRSVVWKIPVAVNITAKMRISSVSNTKNKLATNT
jgi:hypothetical protein